jgi:hypothetical protein
MVSLPHYTSHSKTRQHLLNIVGINVSFHFLAHASQFPHRVIYHHLGRCHQGAYDKDGISRMVTLGATEWVLRQSWVVRNTILLVLLVLCISFFSLIENAGAMGATIAAMIWFISRVYSKRNMS